MSSSNQSCVALVSSTDAMFTIVDLLCESRASVTVSPGMNGRTSTLLTRLESFDPVLPTNAALLHTTPRRARVITVMGVDPYQSSLNLSSEAMGSTNVLRPQGCSEAILARVGQKQAFGFLLSHYQLELVAPRGERV